ncbi:MAG: 16S rRNA (cytosine(1402)-N(4))-methyltransferase RsmH [bacterium]|nr:16S rRNA (cytosine(1402)-N(4))-methyltransferase RsmH [bacterium]
MLSESKLLHKPVMVEEVIRLINVHPGGFYLDCTLGCGGHSLAILEHSSPDGYLVGIDRDPVAIAIAEEILSQYKGRFTLILGNFVYLSELISKTGIDSFDGILFDLGVSSMQLEDPERGFSFSKDGPLDMRMDPNLSLTAHQIVNTFSLDELENIFKNLGEEPFAYKIARAIVEYREKKEIASTKELAEIVSSVVKRRGKIHPATRVFMALRIYINSELENLQKALNQAVSLLKSGGRLCVISYHSLEDRIVKKFFRESKEKIITKSVIKPTREEILTNRRARSARLRGLEKL